MSHNKWSNMKGKKQNWIYKIHSRTTKQVTLKLWKATFTIPFIKHLKKAEKGLVLYNEALSIITDSDLWAVLAEASASWTNLS